MQSLHELARMVYGTAKHEQVQTEVWDKYVWNGLKRVPTP